MATFITFKMFVIDSEYTRCDGTADPTTTVTEHLRYAGVLRISPLASGNNVPPEARKVLGEPKVGEVYVTVPCPYKSKAAAKTWSDQNIGHLGSFMVAAVAWEGK